MLNTKIQEAIATVDPRDGSYSALTHSEYDLVLSTLKKHTGEGIIAEYLASSIFTIADESGVPVTGFLDAIEGQDKDTTFKIMVYYLNQLRNRSTLLGVTPVRAPNFYAARNAVL